MKQIIQNLKNGATEVVDVPVPTGRAGHLLIRTGASLVSAGTERMLRSFGEAGFLAKARQQPDKVRMVIDKIKTDGLVPTIESVKHKLDQPIPMGYCNAGTVVGVGSGVMGYQVGDRVVSNGHHAELVSIPANLCALIPTGVSDETASFAVLGAVALQGIRLATPTLGESFMVTGLGLVGLLAVQLLRAHGCKVLASDFSTERVNLARELGADAIDLSTGADPISAADSFTAGRGMDGVVITASTDSDLPVQQAARMCRKRGRITLVGVTGLNLSRDDFYKKELTFQVSCSYGPGRYDPVYEEEGRDYPLAYVRWTEQRNFEAVLEMMAEGNVRTDTLVSDTYPIEEAESAYGRLDDSDALGIVLNYPNRPGEEIEALVHPASVLRKESRPSTDIVSVGMIGAGNFAERTLLPALHDSGATLTAITSAHGLNAARLARKFEFNEAVSDSAQIIDNPDIDLVVIATRHDSHADLVCRALDAGKNVFVEKPLAITRSQLDEVAARLATTASDSPVLMVGYNRRFSPHAVKLRELMATDNRPAQIIITVNAGHIDPDHWTQNPSVGGGRIIGEACHFVDLARFLAGSRISDTVTTHVGTSTRDSATILVSFENGTQASVHYVTNGHRAFPKERVEIFCGRKVLSLDNFRRLRGYGWSGFKAQNLWKQDKGHTGEIKRLLEAVKKGGLLPISPAELLEVSRATFDVAGI